MYQSGSNYVSNIASGGRSLIRKRYEEKLKEYDVVWPLRRGGVEAEMLTLLKAYAGANDNAGADVNVNASADSSINAEACTYIRIPELVLWQPPDCLVMEHMPGHSLMSYVMAAEENSSGTRLPEPAAWAALFSFLSRIAGLSPEELPERMRGLLAKQQPIVACMYQNKLSGRVDPPAGSLLCLCLGDVSLNNILWDPKERCFSLLDFECAHWGYEGYDAGQLLGMLKAYDHTGTLYKTARSAALGAGLRQLGYWESRFEKYYRSGSIRGRFSD